jgi:hypothetical protein
MVCPAWAGLTITVFGDDVMTSDTVEVGAVVETGGDSTPTIGDEVGDPVIVDPGVQPDSVSIIQLATMSHRI